MKKSSFVERRQSPRFRVECEAELFATVAMLDTAETEKLLSPLVFLGATKNISLKGLALTLPSIRIDENYCQESHSLRVSLCLLTSSSIEIEISPLRCQPLNANDPAEGYLIGARISHLSRDSETELRKFLQSTARQSE